jgi:hypothetical protein
VIEVLSCFSTDKNNEKLQDNKCPGRGSNGAPPEEVSSVDTAPIVSVGQTDGVLYILGLTRILELVSMLIHGILSGDRRTDGSSLAEFLRVS